MRHNMKKIIVILAVLLLSTSVFAEKMTIRTGDSLALSITDYFFPVDINATGSKCSVTSIKLINKDLWCISIAAWRSGGVSTAVVYDYYVKQGDVIKLRRIADPMKECNLIVESIMWNEAVLDIQ